MLSGRLSHRQVRRHCHCRCHKRGAYRQKNSIPEHGPSPWSRRWLLATVEPKATTQSRSLRENVSRVADSVTVRPVSLLVVPQTESLVPSQPFAPSFAALLPSTLERASPARLPCVCNALQASPTREDS